MDVKPCLYCIKFCLFFVVLESAWRVPDWPSMKEALAQVWYGVVWCGVASFLRFKNYTIQYNTQSQFFLHKG